LQAGSIIQIEILALRWRFSVEEEIWLRILTLNANAGIL
jgi:hypothetical protein